MEVTTERKGQSTFIIKKTTKMACEVNGNAVLITMSRNIPEFEYPIITKPVFAWIPIRGQADMRFFSHLSTAGTRIAIPIIQQPLIQPCERVQSNNSAFCSLPTTIHCPFSSSYSIAFTRLTDTTRESNRSYVRQNQSKKT